MKSYRIVLEYTDNVGDMPNPEKWDWYALFDIGTDEALRVISVDDVTPIEEE